MHHTTKATPIITAQTIPATAPNGKPSSELELLAKFDRVAEKEEEDEKH